MESHHLVFVFVFSCVLLIPCHILSFHILKYLSHKSVTEHQLSTPPQIFIYVYFSFWHATALMLSFQITYNVLKINYLLVNAMSILATLSTMSFMTQWLEYRKQGMMFVLKATTIYIFTCVSIVFWLLLVLYTVSGSDVFQLIS